MSKLFDKLLGKSDKKVILKPVRSDDFFMADVLKMALNARVGMILITLIAICLIAVVFFLLSQSAKRTVFVVIDGSTGKTYYPISQSRDMAQALLDRQLIYYSVEMIEKYLDYNYFSIKSSREDILALANSKLATDLGGEKYLDDADVQRVLKAQTRSYLVWEIRPRITLRNEPYYTVFATVERTIKQDGLTVEIKKYNIRVDWGHINGNVDYARRPHALALLNVNILTEGSLELNEQINKLR